MFHNLLYTFRSGKNPKFIYYGKNMLRQLMPMAYFRHKRMEYLSVLAKREDKEYILDRVNYYCKLSHPVRLPDDTPTLAEHRMPKSQKVYYFDTYEFTRWFPKGLHWLHLPGDIMYVPQYPTIVKSRPLSPDNTNSVLMKLDKVRHFVFVNDKIPFRKKMNKVIFRGKIHGKPIRYRLLEMYFNHPMCDLGDVGHHPDDPKEWQKEKLRIFDHLSYKFILALEGNDVASNLKWIMSSNSIAVMPRPTCETWFMEGRLIPNYHYIEIKEDLSDLEERLRYYIEHEDEALSIIRHAHEYVAQFRDTKREKLISLLVLQKYFEKTGTYSLH